MQMVKIQIPDQDACAPRAGAARRQMKCSGHRAHTLEEAPIVCTCRYGSA